MDQSQQLVFTNLSRNSHYNTESKALGKIVSRYTRMREEEIRNEFQVVDYTGLGKLSRKNIVAYLQQKYQTINREILRQLFVDMVWDRQDNVSKQQFCNKYIARQKRLFYEITQSKDLRSRLLLMQDIVNRTTDGKEKLYAAVQIEKAKIYVYGKAKQTVEQEEWVEVQIHYENHQRKTEYTFVQLCYDTTQPSFEVILPVQADYVFIKFTFRRVQGHSEQSQPLKESMQLGKSFINISLNEQVHKRCHFKEPIKLRNQECGYCEFVVTFQKDNMKVKAKLTEKLRGCDEIEQRCSVLEKQYQYLQFLWGIRHKPNQKISQLTATSLIYFRILFVVILMGLGIVVQVLGRCQPLSLICSFSLLRHWKYVIFQRDKLLLGCLGIAALCLDIFWLVVSQQDMELINYMPNKSIVLLTIALAICKLLFVAYMIIIEQAFTADQQAKDNIQQIPKTQSP